MSPILLHKIQVLNVPVGNGVPWSLKSCFQFDYQIDISLIYLGEAIALRHSREAGLTLSIGTSSPINVLASGTFKSFHRR